MQIETLKANELERPGSGQMFDGIAGRYDLLNRIMSLGLDRRWRRRAVVALGIEPEHNARILDVACGTGDVALEILARHPSAEVVGLDPSAGMLAVLENKATRRKHRGAADRLEVVCAAAEEIPFPDASFDGATIAFGLRNVVDRRRGVAEMLRVIRPGGRLVILELTEPRGGGMARLARFHIHRVVPWLGGLLSGSSEYRYLERSIATFPPPPEVAAMLRDEGASRVFVEPLVLGSVHLFVAIRGETG